MGGGAAYITGLSILPDSTELTTALPRVLGLSAGPNIVIVGTDLSPIVELAANAGELKVELQWSAVEHPPHRYHTFLHLLNSTGALVAQYDGPPVSEFPTDTWPEESNWQDVYSLVLPDVLPPGTYQLTGGLYRIDDLTRPALQGPSELLLPDDRYLLATVHVP